ncbi:Uncharacterized protein Rs2_02602 [Raphanus sativus]|nr:Uncharacterized protein Rs2_02602 [Raphanus sativus]
MGYIDKIIAMMNQGSLESEKTEEEVTKKSEVIVSDEPILNQIQPVTTKEGKNEIPLIESDIKTEVMACDGEKAYLASMDDGSEKAQSDEKTENMKKKNKWWKKQTVHVMKINADRSLKKSVRILNPSLLMIVQEKNYLTTQKMVSEVYLVLEERG